MIIYIKLYYYLKIVQLCTMYYVLLLYRLKKKENTIYTVNTSTNDQLVLFISNKNTKQLLQKIISG